MSNPKGSTPPRVVMLTSDPNEEAVLGAILAAASGYFLKLIGGRDLMAALETRL